MSQAACWASWADTFHMIQQRLPQLNNLSLPYLVIHLAKGAWVNCRMQRLCWTTRVRQPPDMGAREFQTRTCEGPALQTPPKFHERPPREREKKKRKLWREKWKKSAKFWASHPSGTFSRFGLSPFGAPSGPHPCMNCCPGRVEGRGKFGRGRIWPNLFYHPYLAAFGQFCFCLGPEVVGGPNGERGRRGPKISRFFLLSPTGNFIRCSLSGGFLVEFWWCLKRWDAQMCAFGVLWLLCEAPAARPPGFHTTAREP